MKTKFFTFILAGISFLNCQGQTKIQTIDPKTFSEKISSIKKPQLIDVRTPEEFNGEHIDKAVNIDINNEKFEANAAKYDKTKPVFVYCKAGGRSSQAAFKLMSLGFKEIYNLEGGMMKWNAAGLSKPSATKVGMTMQEYQKLTSKKGTVLIDFYAVWCGPCKKMAPYLAKMKTQLKGKVDVIKIDADKHKSLMNEMKIDGLPVQIVYKNGKETWRHMGYISESELKKHL